MSFVYEVSKYSSKLGSMSISTFDDKTIYKLGFDKVYEFSGTTEARLEIINRLIKLGSELCNDNGIKISLGSKRRYFSERYGKFREIAGTLSMAEFVSDISSIEKLLHEREAEHVFDIDDGVMYTLDEWLRKIKHDDVYYFGKVMVLS